MRVEQIDAKSLRAATSVGYQKHRIAQRKGIPVRPLVGTIAPDFAIDIVEGGRFRLSDHRDKTVVLDFWATWCNHCAKALPQTMATVKEFSEEGVFLVAVNQQESAEMVSRFLDARDWELRVGLDRDGQVSRHFQVDALPQLVVVAPGGRIQHVCVGSVPALQDDLRAVLKQLVGQATQD